MIRYIDGNGPSPTAEFHWAGARAVMEAVRLVELGTEDGPCNELCNLFPNLFVACMGGREDNYSFYLHGPSPSDLVEDWDAGTWTYTEATGLWTHADRNGVTTMDSLKALEWCSEYSPRLEPRCRAIAERMGGRQ